MAGKPSNCHQTYCNWILIIEEKKVGRCMQSADVTVTIPMVCLVAPVQDVRSHLLIV